MAAVTFTGPLSDGYHVHKRGCRDLDRAFKIKGGEYVRTRGDATWNAEVRSREEAVFAIYDDVMGDQYADDEKHDHWHEYDDLVVFPCVGRLPEEVTE